MTHRFVKLGMVPLLLVGLVTACGDDDDNGVGPDPELYTVQIVPRTPTLDAIGATVQLEAAASDDQGGTVEGATYVWSSSDEDVATVVDGLVTAVGNGTTDITVDASHEGATASYTTTAEVSQVAEFVEADAPTEVLAVDETMTVTVTAADANEVPLEEFEPSFSSTDEDIATIDEDGLVTAVAEGEVMLIAEVNQAADTLDLTVTATAALRRR